LVSIIGLFLHYSDIFIHPIQKKEIYWQIKLKAKSQDRFIFRFSYPGIWERSRAFGFLLLMLFLPMALISGQLFHHGVNMSPHRPSLSLTCTATPQKSDSLILFYPTKVPELLQVAFDEICTWPLNNQ
jgi:hypothetical protein